MKRIQVIRTSEVLYALLLTSHCILFLAIPAEQGRSQSLQWQLMPLPFSYLVVADSTGGVVGNIGSDTLFRSLDHGVSWQSFPRDTAVGLWNARINAEGYIFGVSYSGPDPYDGPWIIRSTDWGETWTRIYGYGVYGDIIQFLDLTSSSKLFVGWRNAFGGGGGVVFSIDNGSTWVSLPIGEYGAAAVVEDDGSRLFLTDGFYVFRSTDTTRTWDTVLVQPRNIIFTDMTVNSLGWVFVNGGTSSTNSNYFRSTDHGESWHLLGEIGPTVIVDWTLVTNTDTIVAVTRNDGVFLSPDNGETWLSDNEGPSYTDAFDITIDLEGFVYLATDSGIFRTTSPITSTKEVQTQIQVFSLSQNYPNPFNPVTTIRFDLPATSSSQGQAGIRDVGYMSLKVYDLLGREVATLVDEKLRPGTYTKQWDASGVASGVYYYRLRSGEFVQTKKLILLR